MITIEAGTKPASKKQALDIVTRLCRGGEVTEKEKHSLYLYFQPKTGKPKNAFEWVASFAAIKDIRSQLKYVYSDGKRLMATNGHILAWCPTDRQQGYYSPRSGDPVTGIDIPFPDIDRVIPSYRECDITLASLPTSVQELGKTQVDVVLVPGGADFPVMNSACLLAEYARKAIAGGNAKVPCALDPNAPVRGKCDLGEFVIMPRRQ